ncbi:DivIVA domain-containing protein [Candidatus Hakubella thermalkaliphila]|nr:DivIVA domain-containing protein [Candidatus Hakubella thermalkaliphila]
MKGTDQGAVKEMEYQEIMNKSFRRSLLGFNREEVRAFLGELSGEVRLLSENLRSTTQQLDKFKSLEAELLDALGKAKEIIREAEEEARTKSAEIVGRAERDAALVKAEAYAEAERAKRELEDLKRQKDEVVGRIVFISESMRTLMDRCQEVLVAERKPAQVSQEQAPPSEKVAVLREEAAPREARIWPTPAVAQRVVQEQKAEQAESLVASQTEVAQEKPKEAPGNIVEVVVHNIKEIKMLKKLEEAFCSIDGVKEVVFKQFRDGTAHIELALSTEKFNPEILKNVIPFEVDIVSGSR